MKQLIRRNLGEKSFDYLVLYNLIVAIISNIEKYSLKASIILETKLQFFNYQEPQIFTYIFTLNQSRPIINCKIFLQLKGKN